MRIFQSRDNNLVEISGEKNNGKYFGLEKVIQSLVENKSRYNIFRLEFVKMIAILLQQMTDMFNPKNEVNQI